MSFSAGSGTKGRKPRRITCWRGELRPELFGIPYGVSLLFFVSIVAIYVWMGGMKGVMYADAFQGGVMFLSMVVLLITVYSVLSNLLKSTQPQLERK